MPDNFAIPLMTRAASVRPESISESDRTVEVVFTTGAMVRRVDWYEGEYEEELVVSPEAMDMSRLNGGAPLLRDHEAWEIDAVLGVVEQAWIEGSEGRATVRFAKDEDSEKVWQKVKDGILRNISVGYFVNTYMEIKEGTKRILRAIDWQPYEISLVAVGADAKASVRSAPVSKTRSCVIRHADDSNKPGVKPMADTENDKPVEEEKVVDAPVEQENPESVVDEPDAPAAAPAVEARSIEIMEMCQLAGVGLKRAIELSRSEKSTAEIRSMLVAERSVASTDEIRSQNKPPVKQEAAGTASRMASRFPVTK